MTSAASTVATLAGAFVVAAVLVIATCARRPVGRRLPPGTPAGRTSRRWSRRAALIGIVGAATALAGPLGAAVVGLAVLILPVHRRRAAERRRRRAIEAAMPDAVELFVLCVHAGRSPTQAIEELASTAPPAARPGFAAVVLALHRGRTLADALGELPRHAGMAGRELASAVATADRDGLPLAPVLDRLAAEARASRRRAGDAAARRLPVQLSFPLVVCTLPSFVLLAIAPAVLGALSTLRGRAP